MNGLRFGRVAVLFVLGCCMMSVPGLSAQSATAAKGDLISLNRATSAAALPNGLELRDGEARVQITALREDVLRIRVSKTGKMPEDASWAVLPGSRTSSVATAYRAEGGKAGFSTKALQVWVDRATLAVTISDRSGGVLLEDARPVEFHGDHFRVYKRMPAEEHYFGLGDKTGPLDRRGGAYQMWNTDQYRFQESSDPLYKAIPFFIADNAGRSYGLFLDNTWRTSFDFGKEDSEAYSFGADGGPIDYYFLYGPKPKQVVEGYAWLTGLTPLPPEWSLGFQQSRYSYMTEARASEVADRMRADRIPCDALYLDIDFQDRNAPFTVNQQAFPKLPEFIQELKEKHFNLVLITDLHIADRANQGYAPYDSGAAGDHFVKNPDGSVFVGKVWPGPAVFPDFTRKESRAWWGTLYKEFYGDGAAGFWNDMNEPSVFETPSQTMPLDVVHRIDEPGFVSRTARHAEIHNVYGMENSRGTYEGLLALKPNQRPFVLTRATYAGGQRYASTWTGDNSSNWNHLRMSTPMLLNLGLSGFSMAGDDIGGYAGSSTQDLLTKWIEVGEFNPIYRDHTEKFTADQEPWVGGAEVEAVRRRYIEDRYRLMPYLYTLAEENSRTGVPMMRPLFLEFPDATADKHPLDLDAANQFMLGPDLLIAPAPYPEAPDSYAVTFPPVGWYDYWTGAKVAGSAREAVAVSTGAALGVGALQSVKITPQVDVLPVFVRAGSILPFAPVVQSTQEKPNGPLTLKVYPGDGCEGSLYQDDGISFAYKEKDFLRVKYSCESTSDGLRLHIGAREGSFQPWWNGVEVTIFGWSGAPGKITYAGQVIADSRFDGAAHSLTIVLPERAEGGVLEIGGR
ncbi:glycoside hydrolase family 31 protein [Tunturibacter empetritectus]|uniref:Alpha-glucosidase n=1 Tax=Tunturiibacter empetritectus TaxID=3069691 RepID=A0A7W8IKH6_9BACT|nr:glycoside hydrolase family 31 protein [Edaphobacter lichenicola]MBB5318849.1 alpha-glucosidase [Edaphobacter lichenicola]